MNTASGRVEAFGAPGIAPTWSSSDKDFVTTALGSSRLWATIGHGIVNEVYWPSTGQPQIRDLGFHLVGNGRCIDLKRERRYRLLTPGPGLPALTIVHHGDDYQLTLELLPDPLRDVLLVRFALHGNDRLVLILAPHLGSTGRDNSAWIDDRVAYARGGGFVLCLAASVPLKHLSCGFGGASDGWQDLDRHNELTYAFQSATDGTVAISTEASAHHGVLALGFAYNTSGACTRARTALAADFDALRSDFLGAWRAWGALALARGGTGRAPAASQDARNRGPDAFHPAPRFRWLAAGRGPARRAHGVRSVVGGAHPRGARPGSGAELHPTLRGPLGELRPSRRARHPGSSCLASAAPGCTGAKRCMKKYLARILVSRETRHPISDRDRFLIPNLARDRGHGTAWFEVGINSLRERNKVTKLNKLQGPSRLTLESAGTDSGLVNLPSTECPFALDPNLSGEVPRNTSSVAKPISKERASALDVGLLACRNHGREEL